MVKLGRTERQRLLADLIQRNPLQTDEDLARILGVSVPTIRLDRVHLGIPELRMRSEGLARRAQSVRAMGRQELVGDLVDLELGRSARSVLDTDPSMGFHRTGILRGHFLFAQADSLALAVVDGEVVLTGLANAKFKQPVQAGEQVVATAEVLRRAGTRWVVLVVSTVRALPVFRAKFVVVALNAAKESGALGRI
ncbi:MAG: transcription factor FapR [Thermaerobacter sp.]|nr:transcription factor FapR [Thermaerobacter sp.]